MQRLLLGMALSLATLAFGQEFNLGSKVTDFTVRDLKGEAVPFSSLKGDVTVVMFIATKCPVSNAYNERMNVLYKDYAAKGVKFLFLNSNVAELPAEMAEHARTHNFAFPVYKDQDNAVADRFGAQVTPEAFVIDSAGVIRYHGYIDDSQNPARISRQSLRSALDALIAGQQVQTAETKAFGCTIKRRKVS